MKSPMIDNESIILKVNDEILKVLGDELPILTKLKKYVVESGGKRVRSLVANYLAEIFDENDRTAFKISAIVEIIHAASLLHDDVLDDANIRRGKPSGKNIFGSKEVILGGDYMFATAIRSLNDYMNPALMDIFTRVIRDLSVAELYQMEYERNPDITLENYHKIIYGKTGSLFQTACEAVAIHKERIPEEIRKCAEIGKNLGMLFQMRDDFLDYFNSKLLQKAPFQDFENGLFTFPVLVVREKMDQSGNEQLLKYFSMDTEERKKENTIRSFLDFIEIYGARELCLNILKEMEKNLVLEIRGLPDHPYRLKIENQVTKLMEIE